MLVQLSVDDNWDRVEAVRELVARCVRATYADDEMGDALSMVVAELLENAVKYGTSGAAIRVALDDREGPTVTVSNSVDDESPHPEKLRERIEWLGSFADPAEAYLATMATVYATGNLRDGGSCLGILRVAYEGHCVVSCDLSQPQVVTVRARYQEHREAAA
jgi:hypothetical protein